MKSLTYFIVAACGLAASVSAAPKRKHRFGAGAVAGGAAVGAGAGAAVGAGAGAGASTTSIAVTTAVAATTAVAVAAPTTVTAVSGAVTRGAQTEVLFEVGGVPGNECLTFRNNGEIVDAACVNTAADRQLTPSTIGATSVLLVQRSFSAGFRTDLVGVDACVGFNGTHFKALPCAGITAVSLVNGELKAGVACASGHDGSAQLTVDTTGANCAKFTTTNVAATAP